MSGTAFDGSPWLTAAEIVGLVSMSFGGAVVGAYLIRKGLEKSMVDDLSAAQADIARENKKSTKRRRYAAKVEASASEIEKEAEALIAPNVVAKEKKGPPSKSSF